MLTRICPLHRADVNYDTFCQVCDFFNRETTGCVAMTLGDRDLNAIRKQMHDGDSIIAGKFSKTGRK